MEEQKNYKQLQDNEGEWYWIPLGKVDIFETYCQRLEGKEYSDEPETFDAFMRFYEDFRTGGDKDVIPDAYLPKTEPAMTTSTTASESFSIKKLSEEPWLTFSPTMNLRFVERELPADIASLGKVMTPARTVRVLQQQFSNFHGEFVWEDIRLEKGEG